MAPSYRKIRPEFPVAIGPYRRALNLLNYHTGSPPASRMIGLSLLVLIGTMNARLYRVILPVADIDAAAAFYSQILCDPGERVSPGRHYFNCGGTILACYDPPADGDQLGDGWQHHPSQYIYFSVTDIEEAHHRAAAAGGTELTDIESMPWGERLFYLQDPFGNPISFVAAGTEFLGADGNGAFE